MKMKIFAPCLVLAMPLLAMQQQDGRGGRNQKTVVKDRSAKGSPRLQRQDPTPAEATTILRGPSRVVPGQVARTEDHNLQFGDFAGDKGKEVKSSIAQSRHEDLEIQKKADQLVNDVIASKPSGDRDWDIKTSTRDSRGFVGYYLTGGFDGMGAVERVEETKKAVRLKAIELIEKSKEETREITKEEKEALAQEPEATLFGYTKAAQVKMIDDSVKAIVDSMPEYTERPTTPDDRTKKILGLAELIELADQQKQPLQFSVDQQKAIRTLINKRIEQKKLEDERALKELAALQRADHLLDENRALHPGQEGRMLSPRLNSVEDLHQYTYRESEDSVTC